MEYDKTYFVPGDKVKCKHFQDAPEMYVVEKVTRSIVRDGQQESTFLGMRCRWFSKNNTLEEGIFSSKDLIKL